MVKAGLRRHITYPNVVATLAIFLVLGGGAYAATKLPKNSVGTKQLKKGAVTPPKLSASAKAAMKGLPGRREPPAPQGPPERPTSRCGRLRNSVPDPSSPVTLERWRRAVAGSSAKPRGKLSSEFRTLSRKRTDKPRLNGKSWVKTRSKNRSA